jgi:hypothetical protein
MAKQSVQSSHIDSIDYSVLSGNLTVKFKNGKEYEYSDVSAATYAAFLVAPSKGAFFSSNIKDEYNTKQVPGAE